jgi:hypothetical protein
MEEQLSDVVLSMTSHEFVEHFMGEALTREEAEYILWERTCFPHGSPAQVRDDIIRYKENPYV